jgi:Na+-translocating ferredoxin:NAD+ oxidoreductase subunit C
VKLKSFKVGGIHPPENKISSSIPIKTIAPPDVAEILLSQHLGAPSEPVVAKGDSVKVGTLIGKSSAFISSNIHSSVSGTVQKIDHVLDASGYKHSAVIIKVEGDDWEDIIQTGDQTQDDAILQNSEILEKIGEAGIVGEGGACFPTQVKYMVPKDKNVDTLIINGVECEPYLTADHRLMLEKPEEIIAGIKILKKLLKVETVIIGIESNKVDAIDLLESKVASIDGISVYPLKVKYPQGAEKQLIKAVSGREVPGGKLPLDIGCVVNNIGTAYAVYEAVQKNKPLIERIVTVSGKNLEHPGNYLVRIGTPIRHLIEAAGGLPENTGKVISGGPMMGKALASIDAPVTKGTSGIVILDKKDARRTREYQCIRCAKCVDVCPMGLEPYVLQKNVENSFTETSENLSIMDCMECGSCSYTCPASIPLLDYIRLGKSRVQILRRERSKK